MKNTRPAKENRQMKSQQRTMKTMEIMCCLQIETTSLITHPEKSEIFPEVLLIKFTCCYDQEKKLEDKKTSITNQWCVVKIESIFFVNK